METSREPDGSVSETATSTDEPFELGPWTVDPSGHRLHRDGEQRHLEPRVMGLLCFLARRPGEVVTRDEVLDAVWHDSIVTDEALTRSVSALRKALDDDSRSPRFIETIHKRGYRLLARPRAPSGGPAAPPSVDTGGRWRWIGVVLAIAVAVGAGAAVWIWLGEEVPEPSTTRFSAPAVTPVTSREGREIDPAVSDDGGAVAYAWNGGAGVNYDIYVQDLDSTTVLQLSDHEATEYAPTWSPDGRRIAYARGAGVMTEVHEVPARGGASRLMYESRADWIHGLDWSPDGRWLALPDKVERSSPGHVARFDLETLETTPLTRPPTEGEGDRHPAISPDGQWVAFVRTSFGGEGEIFIAPVDGGETRRLTADGRRIASLDWTPDGDSIVFASDRSGSYALWHLSLDSGDPRRLLPESGNVSGLSISRRDGTLAYEQWLETANVWRLDLTTTQRPITPERLLASTRNDTSPSFSPDGASIAFVSDRSGSPEIWLCAADGSNPRPLTELGGPYVGAPRWSPDGEMLVFEVQTHTARDLHVVDVRRQRTRALGRTDDDERAPSFSTDGHSIYFGSTRSGAWQIWRMSANGGEAEQVTTDGGLMAFESADGQTLFVARPGIDGLVARPTAGGPARRVVDLGWDGTWGNWAQAGGSLFFVDRGEDPLATLYRFDLATERIEPIADIDNIGQFGLTVDPNGTALLFSQVDDMTTDLARMTSPPWSGAAGTD